MKTSRVVFAFVLVVLFLFTSLGSVSALGNPPSEQQALPPEGPGFTSQFNGDMIGWWQKGVIQFFLMDGYIYADGKKAMWAQTYRFDNIFSNFVYEAKIKRSKGDLYSANTMFIRMGSSVGGQNEWTPGYYFEYTNDQHFSIWKVTAPGVAVSLQPWTYNKNIKSGEWNKLKIIANGVTLKFFINGYWVATVKDAVYSKGFVGLGFYDQGLTGDRYKVDWAKLHEICAADETTGAISAEQQSLNDAANAAAPIGNINGIFR